MSMDGEDWSPVCARPKHPLKFTGNTDASVTVKNRLPVPVTARYIRVVPLTWHTRPALRVELFTLGACCTDCTGCSPPSCSPHSHWCVLVMVSLLSIKRSRAEFVKVQRQL